VEMLKFHSKGQIPQLISKFRGPRKTVDPSIIDQANQLNQVNDPYTKCMSVFYAISWSVCFNLETYIVRAVTTSMQLYHSWYTWETVQASTKVTTECEYEVVFDLIRPIEQCHIPW